MFYLKKSSMEELIIFFLFPFLIVWLTKSILELNSGGEISNTILVIVSVIVMPLSNWIYFIVMLKKKKLSLKSVGHLVTTIQSVLFSATVVGFFIKNPLLFDGYFINTKLSWFSQTKDTTLSAIIDGQIQIIIIPYLISATSLKGYVEYWNFKKTC